MHLDCIMSWNVEKKESGKVTISEVKPEKSKNSFPQIPQILKYKLDF